MDSIETIIHTHGDMLLRISLCLLGNEKDAEDAVQETLLKYIQKAPRFENEIKEKAWLVTVVTNQCRDMLRARIRHPKVELEAIQHFSMEKEELGIMEALMKLPEKFKTVLLLHYVEEYKVEEIARIIGKTPSAVKMRLQKGRKLLEEKYRKEFL